MLANLEILIVVKAVKQIPQLAFNSTNKYLMNGALLIA